MNLVISQEKSKWLLYYDMWIKKGHVIERFISIEMLLVPLLFHLRQLLMVYFLDRD